MKKLTPTQLEAIYNLESNPLINSIAIRRENGINRITIESVIAAPWDGEDGVHALLVAELDEHFPDFEYMGIPANHVNPMTGIEEDLYFINFEGETLIWLVMQIRKDESHGQV